MDYGGFGGKGTEVLRTVKGGTDDGPPTGHSPMAGVPRPTWDCLGNLRDLGAWPKFPGECWPGARRVRENNNCVHAHKKVFVNHSKTKQNKQIETKHINN